VQVVHEEARPAAVVADGYVIVAFSGSREGMTRAQQVAVGRLLRLWGATTLVHGCCVGADAEADRIAEHYGIARRGYPSNIDAMRATLRGCVLLAPPAPPLDRNKRIVALGLALIACPRASSRGTWHAVREAAKLGRPIVVLGEDGRAVTR